MAAAGYSTSESGGAVRYGSGYPKSGCENPPSGFVTIYARPSQGNLGRNVGAVRFCLAGPSAGLSPWLWPTWRLRPYGLVPAFARPSVLRCAPYRPSVHQAFREPLREGFSSLPFVRSKVKSHTPGLATVRNSSLAFALKTSGLDSTKPL